MIIAPIWQDTEYTSSEEVLSYYITYNGDIIFNGRAYRKPDAVFLVINVNRICQNYLSNELPESFIGITGYTTYQNDDAVGDFLLYDSNGTLLETYRFSYDWSYDLTSTVGSPVNAHYAYGQFIMSTTKQSTGYTNNIRISNSTTYCGDYAIYYLDSYGCWRSFLFEGNCKKNDNYIQYEYNKSFNNMTIQFEQGRYISEINTVYELSTGWLKDEEAENFARNVVGTNVAYLHNLKTNKIFPVLVNENGVEYKQYKTNGRHLVEYTISVKESQNKIRK